MTVIFWWYGRNRMNLYWTFRCVWEAIDLSHESENKNKDNNTKFTQSSHAPKRSRKHSVNIKLQWTKLWNIHKHTHEEFIPLPVQTPNFDRKKLEVQFWEIDMLMQIENQDDGVKFNFPNMVNLDQVSSRHKGYWIVFYLAYPGSRISIWSVIHFLP